MPGHNDSTHPADSMNVANGGCPRSRRLGEFREALRADLDFHGANGKHSRHGWHPFPAKFPPQLPQFFIERLSRPGDVVLDPMFGSGTTVLEAARLGRRAVGCDIDPLARLITEAKLGRVAPSEALRVGNTVVEQARCRIHERPAALQAALTQRLDGKTRAFVDYWFRPEQQLELVALLDAIESCAPGRLRRFMEMVFSSTIIAKSGGVSLARDLAHTRPHRVLGKEPKSALEEFAKKLKSALANAGDGVAPIEADIRAKSAEETGLPCCSVDLIVTSPPYANNAIDYMRAHKFSLVWLGWKISDLTDIRARYLGHEAAATRVFNPLPTPCENTIARLRHVDRKKAAALRRYFGEMTSVIGEMHRVMKRGCCAVIVVGTSNLRGIDVETQRGLAAIGESVGFELVHIGSRRLDRDKRMLPARWGGGRATQIEKRMHEEHVIGLMK